MSWGAIGGAVVGAVGSYAAGRSASRGAEDAAQVSADAQMAGLEYLQEAEEVPLFYRDQALSLLAGEYGLAPYSGTSPGYQEREVINPEWARLQEELANAPYEQRAGLVQQVIDTPQYITSEVEARARPQEAPSVVDIARESPLYNAILSNRQAGEEAILRGASATGGLRGGATISDLTRYNTNLENEALLTSYQNIMGGLSSLAGAQGYAPQIAQQYSNIGQTLGAGEAAGSRAMQEAYGGIAQSIGTGVGAFFGDPTKSV